VSGGVTTICGKRSKTAGTGNGIIGGNRGGIIAFEVGTATSAVANER
jgi:hypothetical protein